MSRKKKVPVEDLRKNLEGLMNPFCPMELKIKSGKIFLPEMMSEAILNATIQVDLAEKNKEALPESTVNLARFGPAIAKILNNYDDYIEYQRIKKRSQRKGAFYIEIPTWDRRRLENEIKKSKKMKVKAKEDLRFYQEAIIPFKNLTTNHEDLFNKFSTDFLELMNLFSNPISSIYSQMLKGKTYYHELKEVNDAISSEKADLEAHKTSLSKNKEELVIVNNQLENHWNEFYQTSTGSLYQRKEKEIQNLSRTDPLSQYLGIIKELIVSFDNFIQKQQIQITNENQQLLNKFKQSLIEPVDDLSTLFPDFIQFYLVFSDDVFGKKLNKKPEFSDNNYLLASPGWKAWLQEQQFAQDLRQLKNSDDYKHLINKIDDLNNKKSDLMAKLKTSETKVKILEQNIKDLEEQEKQAIKNLTEWVKEQ
jgi:hypothetical protein